MRLLDASIVVKVAHCKGVQKAIRIQQGGKQESAVPGPAGDTAPGTVKGQGCAAPTLFRYIGNQGIAPTLKIRLEQIQGGLMGGLEGEGGSETTDNMLKTPLEGIWRKGGVV